MTALELTPDAQKVFERAVAASGAGRQRARRPVAGAAPARAAPAEVGSAARDPFTFVAGVRRPPPPAGAARRPAAPRPAAPGGARRARAAPGGFELKGIVAFPGGYLAIVNNQIVKAGDTVLGHRVERITEDSVLFREPGGGTRQVSLPGLTDGPPGGAQEVRDDMRIAHPCDCVVITLALALLALPAAALAQGPCADRLPAERITLNLRDANVQTTLRLLAQQYRVNMIVTDEVKGTVTVDFYQVPAA